MMQAERLEGGVTAPCEVQTVHFPELTRVSLPKELQMTDAKSVVGLLNALVKEETITNDMYLGAILFGSLSKGAADRHSDIDLIHIAQNEDSLHTFLFRLKLQTIFEHLYGIHVDQGWAPLGLKELRQKAQAEENTLANPRNNSHCLDRHSIILVPDNTTRQEIENLLSFETVDPLRPKNRFSLDLPAILDVDLLQHPEKLPLWEIIQFLQSRKDSA